MRFPAFILTRLPSTWTWVRRACGGHWERRTRRVPPFGPVLETQVWWEQYTRCSCGLLPPVEPCEDHGKIQVVYPLP